MSRTTQVITVDPNRPDPDAIEYAAELLRRGKLVAFATETVYGLGADATNPEAVARIFEAKGRPSFNPLIVHADSTAMARSCVAEWPEIAETLALHFWPGPLTLVLPRSAIIPDIVTAGQATVGVRIPRPLVARDLIERTSRPIAAPSANRSTGISPTLASHVLEDLDGRIDLILNSGQTDVGLESTVVDLTTRQPHILRPGPITANDLERLVGPLRVHEVAPSSANPSAPMTSPGQSAVHYAPRTRTVRVDDPDDLARFTWPESAALVVLGTPHLPSLPGSLTQRFHLADPETAAHDLYVVLHQCDTSATSLIVILPPPDSPEWHTIRDRIWRASRPWNDPSSGA
ncbi:MAG: L-threonylcarbamoyladenylate synthase [Isosphaeraceae bacterium]|nr:L-threonylcarbamoyladenylate synthase [Isosphaeraceae bacterium]